MRILLLSDFVPPVRGGLETYVDNLADELAQRGHDVHVATLTEHPTLRNTAVRTHPLRTASARLARHVDSARPFHPPLPDPIARRALAEIVAAVAPDVVHVHTWLGMSLPAVRVPVIVTAHDYALACHRRTLMRPNGAACAGPAAACVTCGRSEYGVAKAAALAATTAVGRRLLHADLMLTLSEHVARSLAPYVAMPVRVIPGFVPASATADHPRPANRPYVMFAGDPGSHKGLDLLLDLWSRREFRGLDLVVATTKPVPTAVPADVVVRRMTADEVSAAWRGAVAAVVPSRWPEPFGMVAVEALTAGTPVIASAVGALPEIVEHERNGLLVDGPTAPGLAAAIRRITEDTTLRARLSEGAVFSSRAYAADRVVPQIVAIYENVAALRRVG